ncbi:MAG: transposase, partial [Cytophagales bacterium]|nr:transposase [Cytophagales bacterium]
MNNNKYFIGIDVSKDTLDIAINKEAEPQHHLTVSNDLKGMKAFVKKAKEWKIDLKNALFCMEYTDLYNYTLLDFLSSNNYAIWVENPVAIKKSGGFQRGKSDKLDAERIAQYAYRFKEKAQLWVPERSVIRKLKGLVGMRENLIKSKDSLSKPLKEYQKFMPATYKMLPKSCKESLKSLEKNIKGVEKQLQELIDSAEKVKHQYTIATSVKGIGPVTACQLILCRGEFTKMPTGKQFACYAGVAPFDYSSGSSVRGCPKVSPWAPKKLKKYLPMAALSAIQVE